MQRRQERVSGLVVFLLLQVACPVADGQVRKAKHPGADAGWPGFRGAMVDGVSRETGVLNKGYAQLEVAWKKRLGKGYSGIAVADNRAVTMFSDGMADVVVALDCDRGDELWRYELGETYKGHDGSQDGPISTPFIFNQTVFALAPRGRLVALNLSSGTIIWSTDLVRDFEAVKPHWGFGTSPLVLSGVLIVQAGAANGMVFGFDPATGQRLWSSGQDDVYYQMPIPIKKNGTARLMVAGNQKLVCIDPNSGMVLWEYAHDGSGEFGSICMVPVPVDDRHLLLKHADNASKLLQFNPDLENHAPTVRWEAPSICKSYSVPVHHRGRIYGYNGRIFSCIDAMTGTTIWRSRAPGDGFPMVVDDHLVITSKGGDIVVAKTGVDTYQEVTRLSVFSDNSWTPPSFATGSIFARSFGEIARIDIRLTDSTTVSKPGEPAIDGTRFGEFLTRLTQVTADKAAAIDRFLESIDSFPMVEPDGRVVFIYRGPGGDLAIGGDLTGFGNKQSMQRVMDTDLFYFVTKLEPDARISYAFIRDFQAVPDPLNTRRTKLTGMDAEMELDYGGDELEVSWLGMPKWQTPAHFETVESSRRGRIESHQIASAALEKEVNIQVYLPAMYDKSDERLPVTYVHGGKLAQEELELPLTFDNLIGHTIVPTIAVFIHHDPPFMGWEAYAKMCAEELPAFIDARYRTVSARTSRAHVAWGFGGLAATYTVLSHSDKIAMLGIQSPMILQTSYIEPVMKKASDAPLRIYIDWGKYDMRSPLEFWDVAELGRKLAEYFRNHDYQPLGGQANDGSGVPSWRNRTDDMLEALLPLSADRD